jgi:hypothetical protein
LRPLYQLAPIAYEGAYRYEVGLFLTTCTYWQVTHPDEVQDLLILPIIGCTGTDVARNRAVKRAQQEKADYLLMVDDDMRLPLDWFGKCVAFMKQQREKSTVPCVLGLPYCSQPPVEQVLVFDWTDKQNDTMDLNAQLEKVSRQDAARRKGIERVAGIGAGCVCYDMRVFDRISPPYYSYTYNEDHTAIVESEECVLHRRLFVADVPIYCDWDNWATHIKPKEVGKPMTLQKKDVDELYLRQAIGIVQAGGLLETEKLTLSE